jgi:uncharacterized membrane protein
LQNFPHRSSSGHEARWLRLSWVPMAAVAATGWCVLVVAAPFVPPRVAFGIYAFGHLVCHQLSDRSFHLHGAQLPVCARCIGIYVGAAAMLIVWSLRSHALTRTTARRLDLVASSRAWLAWGSAPTVVTVLLEWAGVWSAPNPIRALAGVLLGLALAFVVGRAATLHYEPWPPRRLV